MRTIALRFSVLTVPFVVALLCAPTPASALGRAEGDYWVYSMTITEPEFGLSTTGTIRYEFVSEEPITVGGDTVRASVLRVTGAAGGTVDAIDLTASMVIEGYLYEGAGDASVVKSDLTYWTNITWGTGSYSLSMGFASRLVTTYSPPLMSGFDPGGTDPGDSWNETTTVRSVVLNLTADAVESNETDTMTVAFSVGSDLEPVSTGAGDFDALEIVADQSDGGRVVYWWSEELGLFVKEETYLAGEPQPVQTLLLEEYQGSPRTDMIVFIAIGAAAGAVALVVLVLVYKMVRRPPKPAPDSSPPLELLPPPP